MTSSTIHKGAWPGGVTPNVVDLAAEREAFSWEAARQRLDGLPDGRGLNIAHEAVDRHVAADRHDHVALRVLRKDGSLDEVTYGRLAAESNQLAGALRSLGVGPGQRVFTLLGRVPELFAVALGTWKNRSVLSPLFSSYGPEPVCTRLELGEAAVLVTTPTLYRRKVEAARSSLSSLRHVVLVGDEEVAGTLRYADLVGGQPLDHEIPPTDPEDPALLHFTSGTTGTPKGALHVHAAVIAHHETARTALDLHADDTYWCTADPGWVTGTSYGIIGPLTHGVTCIVDEQELDARRWYRTLQDQAVTVWYTAPTALRMLMRAGDDLAAEHDLRRLRHVASVGEPLGAEVVRWGLRTLGRPIHDTWWQTETGGIMIANLAGVDIQPGAMGQPLPGIEATVLTRGANGRALVRDGTVTPVADPAEVGELALRAGWPSMFRGYLHQDELYAACFAGGWYLTGDLARIEPDGTCWFVGRADDVIKTAGHLVGPCEVEGVLMEHPAVVEAGVIGVPDPVAGEVVKAFVVLHHGHVPSDDLRLELIGLARRRLGPAVAPRDITFSRDLPHTTSGKIMRRLLRARELGAPVGDLSALEEARG